MAAPSPSVPELIADAKRWQRVEPQRAYRLIRRALSRIADDGTDVDLRARALGSAHTIAYETRHPLEAERLASELEALLPQCSPLVAARCKVGLGWRAYNCSQLSRALALTRDALQGLLAHGDVDGELMARNNLAAIYRELGAEDRSVALYRENRERARALGQRLLEGGALLNLSLIHNLHEESEAALDAARHSLPLLEGGGDLYAVLMARSQMVEALLGLGLTAEARVASDRLYAEAAPLPMARAMVCFYHARTLRRQGEFAAAAAVAQEGLRQTHHRLSTEKLLLWSEVAHRLEDEGDLAGAARVARKVVAGAERLKVFHIASRTFELLARTAEQRGRYLASLGYLKRLVAAEKESQRNNRERQRLMHAVEIGLEQAQRDAHLARVRTAELEEALARDGMTGLYNHAAFQDLLQRQIARGPVAVVMFDVDDFKSYNDRFGHPAGDALLQGLAAVWRDHLRAEDRLARYGGEEFILLLADHDLDSACQVAERLRAAVESYPARHRQVTVSAGVAASPPWGTDPRALVEAADRALYLAKRSGKNRVAVEPGMEASAG